MTDYTYLAEGLARVRRELEQAARRGGHPCPTLVAVTKKMTDRELCELVRLGVTDIGENYPQSYARRRELLQSSGLPMPRMHMIGSLQTNKVKLVTDACLIHSVDSLHLAEAIDRRAAAEGKVCSVLVEINSADELSKGGVSSEAAAQLCRQIDHLEHLRLCGVMTMGPVCEDEEDYRPYFHSVRRIYDSLEAEGVFETDAPVLSMGMSDSYRVAAEEGATMVRVGTALYDSPSRIIE